MLIGVKKALLFGSFILAAWSATAVRGLAIPVLTVSTPATGSLNGDYTTTKLFVDEIRGDAVPVAVSFSPGEANVTEVEIVTNLNQRDFATADRNSNGIEDAMEPMQTEAILGVAEDYYFRRYLLVPGSSTPLTLSAVKTGAYRLTARWKVSGDPNWRWYSAAGRRDHTLTVSPAPAREMIIYEINTLTMEAAGTQFSQRSTLQDLSDRPGALRTGSQNRFNLAYLQNLGVNTLWFQPWHPFGWENRHLSAADINARDSSAGATTWVWNGGGPYEDVNLAYRLGSPYAVKNFFEVEPRLSADFAGNPDSQADVSTAANRASAMIALQNLIADCDAAGLRVLPDAAFNHTSHDVELGPYGSYFATAGNPGPWPATDRIDAHEHRVFSRENDYWRRADLGFNPAAAPDRYDFNKWLDAKDIFFGRYDALWRNPTSSGRQQNEGDWFDYTTASYSSGTDSGGSFDSVTRGVWNYFAAYAPYWLGKTRPAGQNRNSTAADGGLPAREIWDARGIDGLRCDFAQGIPPQAWEYIINVARSYKWSFVFMAESLDGGAVTYRSNRTFDLLNENLLFAAKSAASPAALRTELESRRNAYGQGLLLLNTSSHDEQNYNDPWKALIRYAVFSSVDGAPMIFPGQELGLSDFYGYDLMERNLAKYVPHFKTYNSLMPLWTNADYGLDQLAPVYSAMNRARTASTALRSSNRYFLSLTNGGTHNELHAVAKFAAASVSPAWSDVVFSFVNMDRDNLRSGSFQVAVTQSGGNLFGLQPARRYNVKNLAAYTAQDPMRADVWLWPEGATGRLGSQVLADGVFVSIPKVPTSPSGWNTEPYEAQFLKLYDVTAPPPPVVTSGAWGIAPNAEFTWDERNAGPDDHIVSWLADNVVISSPTLTKSGTAGQVVSMSVRSVSTAGIPSAPTTMQMQLLEAAGDEDGDGQSNAAELAAATDPFNAASALRVASVSTAATGEVTLLIQSVISKRYQLETSSDLQIWTTLGSATAATSDTTLLTDPAPAGPRRFYRVLVVP